MDNILGITKVNLVLLTKLNKTTLHAGMTRSAFARTKRMKLFCSSLFIIGGWLLVDQIRHNDVVLGRWMCVDPLQEKSLYVSTNFYVNLKSATKPLNVLIAFTRPLITEFADNLNLKHPLLPTISPYPTM